MPYKDKDRQREYQREWYARRRAEYFSDKQCAKCNSTSDLELDHIDSSKKVSHRIWSWSEARRNEELSKCQVLCGECHSEKSAGVGGDLHLRQVTVSDTMVCREGHDLNVVGWYETPSLNGFMKKSCRYCKHLDGAERRNGKVKTIEEWINQ